MFTTQLKWQAIFDIINLNTTEVSLGSRGHFRRFYIQNDSTEQSSLSLCCLWKWNKTQEAFTLQKSINEKLRQEALSGEKRYPLWIYEVTYFSRGNAFRKQENSRPKMNFMWSVKNLREFQMDKFNAYEAASCGSMWFRLHLDELQSNSLNP